jgi:Phage integrase, N-terminal SAM-like domain
MTSLRDMQIRNLSVNTQYAYVREVSKFARHFNQSPELLGREQIRAYQLYLTNQRKLAPKFDPHRHSRAALPLQSGKLTKFGSHAGKPRTGDGVK